MWDTVIWVKENSTGVVPSTWVADESKCFYFWPKSLPTKKISNMVKEASFLTYDVPVDKLEAVFKKTYTSFKKANKAANRLQFNSATESEASEEIPNTASKSDNAISTIEESENDFSISAVSMKTSGEYIINS